MPYAKPSRRVKRKLESNTELHIVPIMNLFLVLIPFLLLAAVFVQISVLDSTLPAAAEDIPAEQIKKEEEKPRLNLTVGITDEGFYIMGAGGVIAEKGKRTTIPKLPDGKYDFEKLGQMLKKIRRAYPDENNVVLVAEDEIDYQTVISTMDTIDLYFRLEKIVTENGTKKKLVIHPNISIGAGIE